MISFITSKGQWSVWLTASPGKKREAKVWKTGAVPGKGHLQEEHRSLAMRTDMLWEPEGRFLKEKLKFKQSLR